MKNNILSLSERIANVKLQVPTEFGVDNIITRKMKECAQMPIGSYFCGFDSSLERLKDVAAVCGAEIDDKTTYQEVAELAYNSYFSKYDKPCAIELMQLLSIPITAHSVNYQRCSKVFDNPLRSFEERLKSAIYYTPYPPPLFDFSVDSYMLGIYSYTRNEEYNEYYEIKYKEPVQDRAMRISQWLAVAEKGIRSDSKEYKSEAENDLLYMLVKPFVEYNKISLKGEKLNEQHI